MNSKRGQIIGRGLVLVIAGVMAGSAGTIASARSGDASAPRTLELLVDGRPAPDVLVWSDMEQAAATLRVVGGAGAAPLARSASITCADRASGEEGVATLPLGGAPGDVPTVNLVAAVPGLPYPIDPLIIESKPAAIISQLARRSVLLVPPDELRRRFRETASYMLETADHHYRVPYGDGLLDCRIAVGQGGGPSGRRADQEVATRPFSIAFGRGLPAGPFARDAGPVPIEAWPYWLVTAQDLPASVEADVRAALARASEAPPTDDAATLAAQRIADDGAAPGPWIEAALGLLATRGVDPPRAARLLALVSVAMSDALRIRRELDDRVGDPTAGSGPAPGEHAVAAGAADTVLRRLFPDDLALLEPLEAASAAWTSGDGAADSAFRRLGAWVGGQVLVRSDHDGSSATWTGAAPGGSWAWRPESPGAAAPLEPMAGTWLPWNLASGSALRPAAPPRPGDPVFEQDLAEVWSVASTLDLAGQQIASYWEDKYGSLTPPGHWTAIALRMVRGEGWSTDEGALLFALLSTAQADAFIAAWDAKFAYWSLRPVAAVRERIDPTWAPYVQTPNFPSYVSGHATTSGAAAAVLAALAPEHADEIWACASQAAESRLLGGIHFRTDNTVGLRLGDEVGRQALARADLAAIVHGVRSGPARLGCLWESGRA